MKILSNSVLGLLAGALMLVMLTQGVYCGSNDTSKDENVLKDVEADTKIVYRRKSLQGVYRKKRAITAGIVTAASSAILAGSSLVGTSMTALMATVHSIVVGIQVENYSKWLLSSPAAFPIGGQIKNPPQRIHPGKKEVMVAHKTRLSFQGSWGTATWLVNNGRRKRIIVMWNVPLGTSGNALALGIINDDQNGSSWFDRMYENEQPGPYSVGRYQHNSQTIQYCDEDMCIGGSMGTSWKPHVYLSFWPKRREDLHSAVRSLIENR